MSITDKGDWKRFNSADSSILIGKLVDWAELQEEIGQQTFTAVSMINAKVDAQQKEIAVLKGLVKDLQHELDNASREF